MIYDYLIVGSGLFGSVFAYRANQQGKKCLVIDKRPQLGGNVYCEELEGINVHKYGAHIFHTSNRAIWNFVNSFVEFNRYTNSPLADYHGKLFNLPFNMNTFYALWGLKTPDDVMRKIEQQKFESGIVIPLNLEEQAILLVGKDVYEILIKEYTEKQWGRSCRDLPTFLIKRLPVRLTFDNNYFNDTYQGIPQGGYNKLIDGLLNGVDTKINCDFFANRKELSLLARKILYTGKIDEFYNYKFGKLNYRSLYFETEVLDIPNYQGNAVINYTSNNVPYTRIIEHKHFEFGNQAKTIISKEFSFEYTDSFEAYYPINDDENNALYRRYKELADSESNIVFGGRLAEYKYYDMDEIVECALKMPI